MAATAFPLLRSPRLLRLNAFASRMLGEFALRPHRLRSALRSATIAALGAGLMASAHIDSSLGPYVVWMLAGTPAAMISWRKAAIFTATEAAAIAASLVAARVLSQSPPLMLLFLGAFGFASTYIINRHKFGSFGIITQVLVLDTLYGVMFAPASLGWRAGASFGAVVVAIGMLALFDNLLWPDPAEGILIESLAGNLHRLRLRILDTCYYYLADHRGVAAPTLGDWRTLASRLVLLERARAEGISEHRRGVLLAMITRVARLESEADVLATIALQANIAPPATRLLFAPIATLIDALGAALAELADDPAIMLRTGPDDPPSPQAARMLDAIRELDRQITEHRSDYIAHVHAEELSSFSSFLSGLRAIVRLLERPLDEPAAAPSSAPAQHTLDSSGAGQSLERYSLKVGLSIVVGYIIGMTSQRLDLSTILTTILITGLPTYGASRRKMNLRLIGSVLGGAITVTVIIVSTPNFETVVSYMISLFIVFLISGYAGQGSERVSYAGKQIGTTIALAYTGISPSSAIDAPLWRIWGILLGTSVVALVFLLLWPEYSGKSLLPRLRKALSLTLELEPRSGLDEIAILRLDSELANLLEQILAVAEDARLEGRASGLAPDALINAVGALRRVAHRFTRIALMRIRQPRPQLDQNTEAMETNVFAGIAGQLQAWLSFFNRSDSLVSQSFPNALSTMQSISADLDNFAARIEANNFERIEEWGLEARRTLLAELQSLRRLLVLLDELNRQLSEIPAGKPS
jgi:uncharacterized membrane protein YccC